MSDEAALLSAIYTGVLAPAGIAVFGTGLTEDQKIAALGRRYQRHQAPTDWSDSISVLRPDHEVEEWISTNVPPDRRPDVRASIGLNPGSETARDGVNKSTPINSTPLYHKQPHMPLPSKGTKRSSGVEITYDVSNKKKKTHIRKVPAGKTVASKAISTAQIYYDSHLLQAGQNEKRLTRLNVKLGKQIYPDYEKLFLENLNGKGLVRMQFAGRCISNMGKRHNHMQMFRHRLSTGETYNPGGNSQENDYPTVQRPNILMPGNVAAFYPAGTSTDNATAFFSANETAMRDIKTNEVYWAPYNLADLEDCSWNLNALKIYRQTPQGGVGAVVFRNQVQTLMQKQHYRMSYLANNNKESATNTSAATYKYKAVINKGNICYDFMNKGTAGAKVELIIYRVKKKQTSGIDWEGTNTFPLDNTWALKSISTPIGVGYLDSCMTKCATDNLDGRDPSALDIIDNANFPLLPKLKATKQSRQPFVEVCRQTFAMPAGSRREMNIELPGLSYDPLDQAYTQVGQPAGSSNPSTGSAGIFDEYTYGVLISCCGIVNTDEMTVTLAGTPKTYNVGDMIGKCDVQFYGTYTEKIQACLYKPDPKKAIIYSNGTMRDHGKQLSVFLGRQFVFSIILTFFFFFFFYLTSCR